MCRYVNNANTRESVYFLCTVQCAQNIIKLPIVWSVQYTEKCYIYIKTIPIYKLCPQHLRSRNGYSLETTLYQERAVFGKMKMDPAKRAQTQNAGEVSSLQWLFSQSVELMMDKVCLHCIRPMLLK